MSQRKLVDIALWVLIIIGFLGALKVSYANFTGTVCPRVGVVPVCYVVLAAYALMIAAMLAGKISLKHYLFCVGWGTAFLIAFLGSGAELMFDGDVCPTTSGGSLRGASSGSIPMCYISLALTIVILVLFLIGPYKRACDVHNANA